LQNSLLNVWHNIEQYVIDASIDISVADVGFGKGRCPIHQKGAPEGAKLPTCARKSRAGGVSGGLPQKFWKS